MRQLFRIVSLLIALAFVGHIGWQFYLAHYGPEAITQRTRELLSKTILNQFEFRDATLAEALEVYRKSLREAGIPSDKVEVRVIESKDQQRSAERLRESRQTLVLSNVPALEAGRYVGEVFDLKLFVEGKEVRLLPWEDSSILVLRTINIDRNFSPLARGPAPKNADGTYDVRPILETMGVTFLPGAWAKYQHGSGKLDVFLTQENIDLIEASTGGCMGNPPSWRDRLTDWFGF